MGAEFKITRAGESNVCSEAAPTSRSMTSHSGQSSNTRAHTPNSKLLQIHRSLSLTNYIFSDLSSNDRTGENHGSCLYPFQKSLQKRTHRTKAYAISLSSLVSVTSTAKRHASFSMEPSKKSERICEARYAPQFDPNLLIPKRLSGQWNQSTRQVSTSTL